MKIALVSYEYAGVGKGGGIGTYMRNLATALAGRGHQVEVFTAADADEELETENTNPKVHAVASNDRYRFMDDVLPAFTQRHNATDFDLLEAPEFCADSLQIAKTFPALPHVIKLHTPTELIRDISRTYVTTASKLRFIAGALARGRKPKPFWTAAHGDTEICRHEREVTETADMILAPSQSILDIMGGRWTLQADRLMHLPNLFNPGDALLNIPPHRGEKIITFLGKLEVRKGVTTLADALPAFLKRFPDWKIEFVGRSMPYPGTGKDIKAMIDEQLAPYADSIIHTGAVEYSKIPGILENAAIIVLPSAWENYPYVCLEAMSAGRPVIGSNAGGMSEMIEDGHSGLLVPPMKSGDILKALITLATDDDKRLAIGAAARSRALDVSNTDRLMDMQEAAYAAAIENARQKQSHSIKSAEHAV
ncbi:MAG: glycosyltransferase family 4 protein [Pseudomonadota bacterium]